MKRLTTIAAGLLLSSALIAQDEALLDEEPEEIRRYTVEIIIFSYAEDVSTGTEISIRMGPPNLKISATRAYDVEYGLTKDEDDPEYRIAFEGAGLTSDTWVRITSEWFDADGSPLPEGLGAVSYSPTQR